MSRACVLGRSWVALALVAGCGRVAFLPAGDAGSDAASMDAAVVDATSTEDAGFDATVLTDAGAVDAPAIDASADAGLDAGPDASPDASPDAGPDAGSDAGPDAGPPCAVAWATLFTSSADDTAGGPWVDSDAIVHWNGTGSASSRVGGLDCPSPCEMAFRRDGSTAWVTRAPGYATGGPARIVTVAAITGSVSLAELDRTSGASIGPVDTLTLGASVIAGVAFDSGSAVSFYGTATGSIDLVSGPTPVMGRGGYVMHWVPSGPGWRRDWAVQFDGAGDDLLQHAALLADGAVGVWARAGSATVCVGGVTDDGGFAPCVPASNSLLMVVSASGVIESAFTTTASIGNRVTFLDDHGTLLKTTASLERHAPDGALLWSRPLVGSWFPATHMAHDPARGRVLLVSRWDATMSYDGMALPTPAAADGTGLVVLELDDATGALERVFPVDVSDAEGPTGIAFDDLGRIYVSAQVSGTIDLCSGPLVTDARDALLFAID